MCVSNLYVDTQHINPCTIVYTMVQYSIAYNIIVHGTKVLY